MKKEILEIYKGKTVLITGTSGFKGSWLSLLLLEQGAKVIGYSLAPPTKPSLFDELKLDDQIIQYYDDIRNLDGLKKCLTENKPDFVFHLAAQSLVRESYVLPIDTFEINTLGTAYLLEAVRQTKIKTTVICATSDKCYENQEWIFGYRENDPLGGYDPYSASKGAAEIVINSFRDSFLNPEIFENHGVKIASVRVGNVIGGGDWAKDRIVPDCIRSLINGETISVRNPAATRPWQHVLEPLVGYLVLGSFLWQESNIDKLKLYSSSFNFGPCISSNQNVGNLVKEIINIWGSGDWEIEGLNNMHEASLLNLTIDKSFHLLSWLPVWNFNTAIKETIEWYKVFYSTPELIETFTLDQIKRYLSNFLSS
jgi:CDP-glucose 4,6-dehydratase